MRIRSVAFILAMSAHATFGATLYQSATGNGNSIPGAGIIYDQFLGSRFTLTSSTHITGIGGAFAGAGGQVIFGAILEMHGLLPQGSPFNGSEVLLSTLFTPINNGDDIAPVSITLPPGSYALVFGTNEFGATGESAMPFNGTNTAEGAGSYFIWQGYNRNSWLLSDFDKARFVVTGDVSEPDAASLTFFGLVAICAFIADGNRRRIPARH